jgi:CheY-like chemotaxis protein
MAKILLVEDDPFIADIYKKKFESSGFEVLNIMNGRSVLKAVEEQHFDIILLDLVIPEMSGLEVLRELRGPKYPTDLKIVIFSNLSNQEDREQAVKLGANGFISKTEFSPSQVVEEVNRYLRQFGEQNKNENRRLVSDIAADFGMRPGNERKRILFIEDEEVFVDMFGKKLSDEGYEVLVENDGAKGLDRALREEHLDLVITDAMLPGMNGKDVVEGIRAHEKIARVPIFVISASVDDEDMHDMLAAGATKTYLKTKIVPSQLADEVRDFFAGK